MKKLFMILLALSVFALLCACGEDSVLPRGTQAAMTIDPDSVSPGGLTLTVSASGPDELNFGERFTVERQDDSGNWNEVEPILTGDVFWNSIGYGVVEGSPMSFDVDWTWLYGSLAPGDFRIVKEYFISGDPQHKTEISAEFSISDDMVYSDVLIPEKPPALAVSGSGDTIQARSTGYSWNHKVSDTETASVIADGVHPLDLYSMGNLGGAIPADETVELRFAIGPDSVTARCWPAELAEEPSANSENAADVRVSGDVISAPGSGSYIFELYCVWEGDSYWSGDALYCFAADFE